jgi:glycosyltransferase involved in cell wall biosynthesis
MSGELEKSLVMVPAWPGQETRSELERQAAAGERARTDYVELARALNADVMDMQYMTEQASPVARLVCRRAGLVLGQVAEGYLRRARYAHIVARADRLGLPLALLYKATGARRDLVLISVWLSRPKKAVFLSRLKVHSHLGAIISYGSVQNAAATDRLGVPRRKLHHALQPVGERFWRPVQAPARNWVVSVGSEARDYPTLARALEGLDVDAHVAVGSSVLRSSGDADAMLGPIVREAAGVTPNCRIHVHQQVRHRQLRDLYARSRFVVVPLHDVEFDAGVTSLTEAMAMGKAVIVTRTRGQADVVRHGETGLYVPPGEPAPLRAAVRHLLDNPDEAERMGWAGRAAVEARHTLDRWVADVAGIVSASPARRVPVPNPPV